MEGPLAYIVSTVSFRWALLSTACQDSLMIDEDFDSYQMFSTFCFLECPTEMQA